MLYSELFDTQRAALEGDVDDRVAGEGVLKTLALLSPYVVLPMLAAVDSTLLTLPFEKSEGEFQALLDVIRRGRVRFTEAPGNETPLNVLRARLADPTFYWSAAPQLNSSPDLRRLSSDWTDNRVRLTRHTTTDEWLDRVVQLDDAFREAKRNGIPTHVHGPRDMANGLRSLARTEGPALASDLPELERDAFQAALNELLRTDDSKLSSRSWLYANFVREDRPEARDLGPGARVLLKDQVVDRAYVNSLAKELGSRLAHHVFDSKTTLRVGTALLQADVLLLQTEAKVQALPWERVCEIQKEALGSRTEAERLLVDALAEGFGIRQRARRAIVRGGVGALADERVQGAVVGVNVGPLLQALGADSGLAPLVGGAAGLLAGHALKWLAAASKRKQQEPIRRTIRAFVNRLDEVIPSA